MKACESEQTEKRSGKRFLNFIRTEIGGEIEQPGF